MNAPANCQDFDNLTVGPIGQDTAWRVAVSRHYSGKWNTAFGVRNFGIFADGDRLLGVAVYGNPMNTQSWPSITTTAPEKCIELNRLWVDDELGGNTETWFLARTFRLLRDAGYELIQSFADGRLGVGTTYQAANFTYHGAARTLFWRRIDTGELMHGVPFTNAGVPSGMVSRNVLIARGLVDPFYVTTYRYLKPLTKAAKKSVLIPEKPYPKERLGIIAAPNYRAPVTQIARAAALAAAVGDERSRRELADYLDQRGHDSAELIRVAADNPFVTKARESFAVKRNDDTPLFDIEEMTP